MPDTALGMFETVKSHGEQLVEHVDKLDDHATKLGEHAEEIGALKVTTQALLDSDVKHDERLKRVEENAIRLEMTVMRESQETRSTMREQGDRMLGLVENSMEFKSTKMKQVHDLKMAKLTTWSNVILKIGGGLLGLLSSGGILFYLIQALIKNLGGE